MALSSEEITAAENAHRFVKGYKIQSRGMVACNLVVIPIAVCSPGLMLHRPITPEVVITFGLCLAVATVVTWFHLLIRYREAVVLLRVIEREHGDELPWIKNAEALVAAREIDLAAAKYAASH